MFCASGRVVDRARRVHVRVPHPAARAGNAIYTVTAMPCPHCAAALGWLPQVPFPFRHTSALCRRPPAHPFRLLLIPLTTSTLPPSAGTRAMLSDPIDPVLRCRCGATGSGSGALYCCADCITVQCSPAVRKPNRIEMCGLGAAHQRGCRDRRAARRSRTLCAYLLRRPGCLACGGPVTAPVCRAVAQYCGAVLRRSLRTATKSLWSPVDQGALTTSTPQYSVEWCCSSRRRTGQARWRMTQRQTHRRHRCAFVDAALQHPQRFRAGRRADLTA